MIIPRGDAVMHFANIVGANVTYVPDLPLLTRATAISSSTFQGVYDCLYVALAEREGCSLLTADAKLVSKLSAQFPFIVPLSSLP